VKGSRKGEGRGKIPNRKEDKDREGE